MCLYIGYESTELSLGIILSYHELQLGAQDCVRFYIII